ncbi:hypothetical protein OH77DRAFT_572124 [Trametes cingulata]|nr:hypothetical protein OH77DRAFT_572124 [Trametes cingulata]
MNTFWYPLQSTLICPLRFPGPRSSSGALQLLSRGWWARDCPRSASWPSSFFLYSVQCHFSASRLFWLPLSLFLQPRLSLFYWFPRGVGSTSRLVRAFLTVGKNPLVVVTGRVPPRTRSSIEHFPGL